MSGGSYNYLERMFSVDPVSLIDSPDLRQMADDLENAYPGSKAAQDTRKFVEFLDTIQPAIEAMGTEALVDVWHAQEWFMSCDWSEDQVDEAVRDYQAAEPAHPHCSKCEGAGE